MEKKKNRLGIIQQVTILFVIGILVSGVLTYAVQRRLSEQAVIDQTEQMGRQTAGEVRDSIREFPASDWLLRYWTDHADDLSIEYDKEFTDATVTEMKCRILTINHPNTQLRYVTEKELETWSEHDRQWYAEIAYSWLITRINHIKRNYQISFLFGVVAQEPYTEQLFLFSAADEGATRGRHYEDVYPLGTTVTVDESLQEAMRSAVRQDSHLADAGNYADCYEYMCSLDGDRHLLIGMTYDLTTLRANVSAQTGRGTRFAMLCQLALSAICLLLIYFYVLRPLKRVEYNIRQYQQTKDSAAVAEDLAQVHPSNEIGQLSEDIVSLTREIDDHVARIGAITAERERISTELELASAIQESMLPNVFPAFPDRREFEVYAMMDPAKEVGGDFYDFFLIDDDHLYLTIADVSGKGVPASLFMMAAKIHLANYAKTGHSPAQILQSANEAICANNKMEMFVTVWIGILEISTGRLTAANAGHEYPVLMKAGGAFEIVKDRHGFVLGGMEGLTFREYELQLTPGSKLFVYTDGVPEATDKTGTLFGTERMLQALNDDREAGPERVLYNVHRAVDRFVLDAEQFDDLTMVCLEYRG